MPLTKLSPSEQTAVLKRLLDATLEGFFAIDEAGRVTLCNAAGAAMLGYDGAEDLDGRDIRAVMAAGGDWPVLQAMAAGAGRRRIVGMTAHALAGDRERCIGVGMDDYIAKPFNPEDLRRKLQGA